MRVLGLGLLLTAVVGGILWFLWGDAALVPAAVFGLLATGIQLAALRLVQPVLDAPFSAFVRRWLIGVGLRLAGVALVFVAIAVDRSTFPPLPTALAFLGVVVPLLFTEIRYVR